VAGAGLSGGRLWVKAPPSPGPTRFPQRFPRAGPLEPLSGRGGPAPAGVGVGGVPNHGTTRSRHRLRVARVESSSPRACPCCEGGIAVMGTGIEDVGGGLTAGGTQSADGCVLARMVMRALTRGVMGALGRIGRTRMNFGFGAGRHWRISSLALLNPQTYQSPPAPFAPPSISTVGCPSFAFLRIRVTNLLFWDQVCSKSLEDERFPSISGALLMLLVACAVLAPAVACSLVSCSMQCLWSLRH